MSDQTSGPDRGRYDVRVTELTIVPSGESIDAEGATIVAIDSDDAGGEYIRIRNRGLNPGIVPIDPDEWPFVRHAIDKLVADCRGPLDRVGCGEEQTAPGATPSVVVCRSYVTAESDGRRP